MSLKVAHKFLYDWNSTYGDEHVPSKSTPVTTPPIEDGETKEIPETDWKWADNPTG